MIAELEKSITEIAESVAESMGLEILDLRWIPHHRRYELRIALDHTDRPVSVDDCAEFSRKLSSILEVRDVIADSYVIEVSSPGFRRKIRIPKDLARFCDRRVKVRLVEPVLNRSVWIGTLLNDRDPLEILTDESGTIHIAFNNIKQLNLHE